MLNIIKRLFREKNLKSPYSSVHKEIGELKADPKKEKR
jgi:hypothetical protein